MLINKRFILASSSVSRYKILKQANLNFSRITPSCDEGIIKKKLKARNTSFTLIPKKLAYEKAYSISKDHPGKLVIGVDTVIVFDGMVVDKVANKRSAENKIKKFSGKKHKIISAVSAFQNKEEVWNCHEKTIVEIRDLSTEEIKKYVKTCGTDIFGSVGCYQIEKHGPQIIKNINGDFFNVMGLPLFPLLNFLKKFNIKK